MENQKGNSFNQKLYAPMILSSILNPVNSSIISVALIPIGTALKAPPSQTAWLVSALYLATAIGQPVVGKLIDTIGPKVLYQICATLVAIGSLFVLLSPNIGWLVAARVLIGFGTCAGYPSSMYLIRKEAERTGEKSPSGILTMLSIANQSVAVVGPALGGILISLGGWQSAFMINLPLSLSCLVLGSIYYPRTDRVKEAIPKFDYVGMSLFSVMMIALLLFLMNPRLNLIYLLAVAMIALGIFVFYELRIAIEPFIPIRVLKGNKPLLTTYTRTLLTATTCYSFIYGFAQWLQEGRGLSPSVSGLISIPMFAVALLVTGITGNNPRIFRKLLVGAMACIVAFLLILFLRDHSPVIFLFVIAAVMGIPQGLNNLANQNALYHQAQTEQLAASTGLMRTFQYLGAMFASAANGALLHDGAHTGELHKLAIFQIVVSAGVVVIILLDHSIRSIDVHSSIKKNGKMLWPKMLLTPLGWLLRRKRAGEENAYQHDPRLSIQYSFELSSPAFFPGEPIPIRHAGIGRGDNISPELNWTKPPEGTMQLLLIMEDIDVPFKKPILHVVALMKPTCERLSEGALTSKNMDIKMIPDRKGRLDYHGPRALPGHGTHRYRFHLYALNEVLPMDRDYMSLEELLPLAKGHIMAGAHLEGTQIG